LVSLADKIHNASAINADLIVHGSDLWERFTGGRDGSLWYYDALAGVFETHLPGPASARLRKLVLEMHALAASDEVEQGEIELRSEGH
jgi:hypothetical protein